MLSVPPLFLGLGANIDYELCWDEESFATLLARNGVTSTDGDTLLHRILKIMLSGKGAEFSVPRQEDLEMIYSAFTYQETLGGTAARAALIALLLDKNVRLHVVDEPSKYRNLLPVGVDFVWDEQSHVTSSPHVIIQYPKGANLKVGEHIFITQRANRIILTGDAANSTLPLSCNLPMYFRQAVVVLMSGFNAMDDKTELLVRLRDVEKAAAAAAAETFIVYEDAAFHNEEFHDLVLESAEKFAHCLSFNEDELSTRLRRDVDFKDCGMIADALTELSGSFPDKTILIHTADWSAIGGKRKDDLLPALICAVATSAARYVQGDAVTVLDIDKMRAKISGGVRSAFVTSLESLSGWNFIETPRLQITNPTTIGLGDSFIGGFVSAVVDLARLEFGIGDYR
ncbi:ADP-dependent glucokinase/phosphofructokinase [Trueperella pyogenes]|uniref:ADP-dependent glucokinase/phosphofructokinase n=1 Tax=Trueperella pyogenes TaxID=1661 RepID=UPI0024C00B21|nr:ADP-dependent glucokinase/phosphofructokinase [Trueperella pyogenes]WHU57381.1 ADP-dependent glucokinase/phosphofructokinase [Trueperella pyogenes]